MPQTLPIKPQVPILFKFFLFYFIEEPFYSGSLAAWSLSRAQGSEMSCRGNSEQQTIASSPVGGKHTVHGRSSPYTVLVSSRRA